uniref:Uncharacterized protein n=1 Tax=Eptatretus burgeri TaxID=7764 RepID=A0A8C4RA39_EPTBU
MERAAQQLLQTGQSENDEVRASCDAMMLRKEHLLQRSQEREQQLEESMELQRFFSLSYELESWLQERLSLANDGSWQDLTSLQMKLARHAELEAELSAMASQLQHFQSDGRRMMTNDHSTSQIEVTQRLVEVDELWKELEQNCHEKRTKLQDAVKVVQLLRAMDEVTRRASEAECGLASPERPQGLAAAAQLLQRLAGLTTELGAQSERACELRESAWAMAAQGSESAREAVEKAEPLVTRLETLEESAKSQRAKLESSRALFEFYRAVELEFSWLREAFNLAASQECGHSLADVTAFEKRHQALEAEMQTHSSMAAAVAKQGRDLVSEHHSDSTAISQCVHELEEAVVQLHNDMDARKKLLLLAHEMLSTYTELTEMQSWLDSQWPLVKGTEDVRDEEGVQVALSRLEALHLELEGLLTRLQDLEKKAKHLISKSSLDSTEMRSCLIKVSKELDKLQHAVEERRKSLRSAGQIFEFQREVEEMRAWITQRRKVARSDDFGKDLEDVEILHERFAEFKQEVEGPGMARMAALGELGTTVMGLRGRGRMPVHEQLQRTTRLWGKLQKDMAQRDQNLQVAREVHSFCQQAEELTDALHQHQVSMTGGEVPPDLNGIVLAWRRHASSQRDLEVAGEKVKRLAREAMRLSQAHPKVSEPLQQQFYTVEQEWEKIQRMAEESATNLRHNEEFLQFMAELHELEAWCSRVDGVIRGEDHPKDMHAAELARRRHEVMRPELERRLERLHTLQESAKRYVKSGHPHAEEMSYECLDVEGMLKNVAERWENSREHLGDVAAKLQTQRALELVEAWMEAREGLLTQDNYGDSLQSVEELIRKHEDLEQMFAAQEEKFTVLAKLLQVREDEAHQQKSVCRNLSDERRGTNRGSQRSRNRGLLRRRTSSGKRLGGQRLKRRFSSRVTERPSTPLSSSSDEEISRRDYKKESFSSNSRPVRTLSQKPMLSLRGPSETDSEADLPRIPALRIGSHNDFSAMG